jgi:hypothetical protein
LRSSGLKKCLGLKRYSPYANHHLGRAKTSMTSFAVNETNGMSDGPFCVYLDTNVRALESSPEEAQDLQNAFALMQQNRNIVVTSELTLAELLAPSRHKNGWPPCPDPNKRRFYLSLIVWSGFIDLRPLTRTILTNTADLRMRARVKLPDAIRIVTATEARCAFFMSGDHGAKCLPPGMTHFLPDPPAVRALMDALCA